MKLFILFIASRWNYSFRISQMARYACIMGFICCAVQTFDSIVGGADGSHHKSWAGIHTGSG